MLLSKVLCLSIRFISIHSHSSYNQIIDIFHGKNITFYLCMNSHAISQQIYIGFRLYGLFSHILIRKIINKNRLNIFFFSFPLLFPSHTHILLYLFFDILHTIKRVMEKTKMTSPKLLTGLQLI